VGKYDQGHYGFGQFFELQQAFHGVILRSE